MAALLVIQISTGDTIGLLYTFMESIYELTNVSLSNFFMMLYINLREMGNLAGVEN